MRKILAILWTLLLWSVCHGSAFAAIAASSLTSGNTTSTSSAVTASVTVPANTLVIVSVFSGAFKTTPNTPTLSGAGSTWTQINTGLAGSSRTSMFRTLGGGGTGAITIDFGGQTQTDVLWTVSELTGTKTTGTNGADAIVQSVVVAGSGSSFPFGVTNSLASFASALNYAYGFTGVLFSTTTPPGLSAGSGYTAVSEPYIVADKNDGMDLIANSPNTLAPSWTWLTLNDTGALISIAVELAASTGATSGFVFLPTVIP